MKLALRMIACCLLGVVPAVLGHHAFSAEYDSTKPVTVKGKFLKMDWINPHSWVYLEVVSDGKVVTWKAEALPPNGLYRQGWRRDSLKAGEEISVEGFLAKDGSNTMWSRSVTTADGRRMFAGSAESSPGAPPATGKQ